MNKTKTGRRVKDVLRRNGGRGCGAVGKKRQAALDRATKPRPQNDPAPATGTVTGASNLDGMT